MEKAAPAGKEHVILEHPGVYFVNKLIAQEGLFRLTSLRIRFEPTGLLDRAIGAQPFEIWLERIEDAKFITGINRRLIILTDDNRIYRFIGRDLESLTDRIREALHGRTLMALADRPSSEGGRESPLGIDCPACRQPVEFDFNHCPWCGEALRDTCSGCRRQVQPSWVFCPECGEALGPSLRRAGRRNEVMAELPGIETGSNGTILGFGPPGGNRPPENE